MNPVKLQNTSGLNPHSCLFYTHLLQVSFATAFTSYCILHKASGLKLCPVSNQTQTQNAMLYAMQHAILHAVQHATQCHAFNSWLLTSKPIALAMQKYCQLYCCTVHANYTTCSCRLFKAILYTLHNVPTFNQPQMQISTHTNFQQFHNALHTANHDLTSASQPRIYTIAYRTS